MSGDDVVQGLLVAVVPGAPREVLVDVIGDPMSVYEAGRDAVRARHADQGIDPEVTARMIRRMAHLVDSPPPGPDENREPHVIINRPSWLMWAVLRVDENTPPI